MDDASDLLRELIDRLERDSPEDPRLEMYRAHLRDQVTGPRQDAYGAHLLELENAGGLPREAVEKWVCPRCEKHVRSIDRGRYGCFQTLMYVVFLPILGWVLYLFIPKRRECLECGFLWRPESYSGEMVEIDDEALPQKSDA